MGLFKFLSGNAPWLATGCLLTLLSSFGQTFFISIFAGEIRVAYGLSHGAWGGIYSLGTTASAVAMVWAGGLTDIFRVRVLGPVVLVGLAASCAFMAINSISWLLPVVIFSLRFFGQGMSSHIAMVAMSRWFIAARGKALSVASLGFSVGEAVLPIAFVALMTVMGWRMLWGGAAVICLAGVPLLMMMLRQERTPQSMAQNQSSAGMNNRHWTRRQALTHPLFWFVVPTLLGPAAFNTAFFFHQVHFAEIKGWTHAGLVALFPFYTVVSVAAMAVSGWAVDRFGTARLMPYFQLPMVISFLVFSMSDTSALALVGFLFLGLTAGANSTIPTAFWSEFYGTAHIGAIKATAAAVMVFGSAIGPGITGMMIDFGTGLETQFVWIALYFLVAIIILYIGVSRAKSALVP